MYNVLSGDGYTAKYALKPRTQYPRSAIELNIHTPAFYSSMVGYDCIIDFMQAAVFDERVENRTASCSSVPHELLGLLQSAVHEVSFRENSTEAQGPLTSVLSRISSALPCEKLPVAYPQGNPKSEVDQDSIQTLERSKSPHGIFMLSFVQSACTARVQWVFYNSLLQILAWRLLVKISGGALAWGS